MNAPETRTRRFVFLVIAQTALLFFLCNVIYLVAQPLNNPHLTIYNALVPGRLRFPFSDDNTTLYVNETLLPRLIGDHMISRPKAADEYRVIVLGSSETWGRAGLKPTDTEPALLDAMGLHTPDGRVAHFYNLAYVHSDIMKDLLILQAALDAGTDPDMVILNIVPNSIYPRDDTHWLVTDNADFATQVIERYGITDDVGLLDASAEPFWWRHSFVGQRSDVAAWLTNQIYGLSWAALDNDLTDASTEEEKQGFIALQPPGARLPIGMTRTSVMHAFAELSEAYALPVLVVQTPINYLASATEENPLREQTSALGFPHLNCMGLLPPEEFADSRLHMMRSGNRTFAGEVARWLQAWWQDPTTGYTSCPTHIDLETGESSEG